MAAELLVGMVVSTVPGAATTFGVDEHVPVVTVVEVPALGVGDEAGEDLADAVLGVVVEVDDDELSAVAQDVTDEDAQDGSHDALVAEEVEAEATVAVRDHGA